MAPAPAAPRPGVDDAGATRIFSTATAAPTGRVVGVLVAVEGELEGEIFRLADGENFLGRSRECGVHLSSEWISRRHAKIIHMDGQFVVGPLSEQNPTLINGDATEGTELKDGDYLKLGRTTLRFRSVV